MVQRSGNRLHCHQRWLTDRDLIGHLHQVFHFWFFDDMADRQRRHDAVAMNPRWQDFLDQIRPLVVAQDSKLMTPAPVADMSPLFTALASS